ADDYTLLTPENVELRFDVAGLGSRVAAALIDYIILYVGILALAFGGTFLVAFVLALFHDLDHIDAAATPALGYIVLALVVVLIFLATSGYFILFELLSNGQSIGKRRLGLRVVREGGQPVNLTASLVRNLMRAVDLFLFIGVFVMLIDSRSRR